MSDILLLRDEKQTVIDAYVILTLTISLNGFCQSLVQRLLRAKYRRKKSLNSIQNFV